MIHIIIPSNLDVVLIGRMWSAAGTKTELGFWGVLSLYEIFQLKIYP